MRFAALFYPALALAALSLGGCESISQAIGLEKTIPDEFTVVSSAPLAIPPDYALRPPRPGAAPSQEVSPTDQAKQTIFRAGGADTALPGAAQRSAGENALLAQAGASQATPDIRQLIAQEAQSEQGPLNQSFVDKLLFWRGPETPADQVIDPTREAQELKGSQAAANAPITRSGLSGVPTIERARPPSLMSGF
jgi:Protein of unknown function (DUF3035)